MLRIDTTNNFNVKCLVFRKLAQFRILDLVLFYHALFVVF